MRDILFPALAMGALGLVLGALLAIASKIFAVEKDEVAEAITEVLPGANCGSCGFAGCSAYANAISKDGAKINACSPGGQNVADAIAGLGAGTILGYSIGITSPATIMLLPPGGFLTLGVLLGLINVIKAKKGER